MVECIVIETHVSPIENLIRPETGTAIYGARTGRAADPVSAYSILLQTYAYVLWQKIIIKAESHLLQWPLD